MIRFCLVGASGKMGQEVIRSLPQWSGIQLVSTLGFRSVGKNLRELSGKAAPDLIIQGDLKSALSETSPDVLLDLSEPSVALKHTLEALENKVATVVGTSGLQPKEMK